MSLITFVLHHVSYAQYCTVVCVKSRRSISQPFVVLLRVYVYTSASLLASSVYS